MLAKEVTAFLGIFVLVCAISELTVRWSPHIGTACVVLAFVKSLILALRNGEVSMVHVKILLVLAISAVSFLHLQLDKPGYNTVKICSVLLLLNVLVLVVPLTFNEKWLLIAQVLVLTLLTPKDPFSETSRSYWHLHVGVLLMFYLRSEVSSHQRVALVLTVLPMLIPILYRSDVRTLVTYRMIGILIFLMSPLLWTPTLEATPSPFKKYMGKTSWNELADLASRLEKSRLHQVCGLIVNICLCLRMY